MMEQNNYKTRKKLEISFRRWLNKKSPSKKIARCLDLKNPDDYASLLGNEGEIDHIVPLCFFDLNNEEEIKLAWCVDNLRRISTEQNKNRGASAESAYLTLLGRDPICEVNYRLLLDRAEKELKRLHPKIMIQVKRVS